MLGRLDFFPPYERVTSMLASMPKSNIRQRLMRTKEGKSWGAWPARSWRSWSLPDALLGPDQTGRVQTAIAEGEYYRMQTRRL